MLFSSYTFLLQFLPAVVLAFAAARRHSPRAGILVLVCASLFFYGAWRPVYLVAVALSALSGLRSTWRCSAISNTQISSSKASTC
jgi:hypothetical protein